jgi:hypothetical protein
LFARDYHFININSLSVSVAIIPESDLQIAGNDGDFDRCSTPFVVTCKGVHAVNPRVFDPPVASSVSFQIKAVVVIKAFGLVPELNLDHRVARNGK